MKRSADKGKAHCTLQVLLAIYRQQESTLSQAKRTLHIHINHGHQTLWARFPDVPLHDALNEVPYRCPLLRVLMQKTCKDVSCEMSYL